MQKGEEIDKSEVKPIAEDVNGYAKYTGIAFQMIAIIGAFTFGGYKLDAWLGLKYPIFTIILILLSVVISIYSIVRSLTKP